MATIIKLKRGTSTPTTSDLANGEVGIDTSAKKLYINDSGTIKLIGGSGSGGVVGATVLGGDVRGYTGDGSTVAFTVSDGADVENVLVFLNGVYQRPTTDYTVSSTTLTFGTAPVSGDVITSCPGFTPIAEIARAIADVPLLTAQANLEPTYSANSLSNLTVSGPLAIMPESNTFFTAAISSSPICGFAMLILICSLLQWYKVYSFTSLITRECAAQSTLLGSYFQFSPCFSNPAKNSPWNPDYQGMRGDILSHNRPGYNHAPFSYFNTASYSRICSD